MIIINNSCNIVCRRIICYYIKLRRKRILNLDKIENIDRLKILYNMYIYVICLRFWFVIFWFFYYIGDNFFLEIIIFKICFF